MNVSPCSPCCSTALTTNIPGAQGATGANGEDGDNAFSTTQVDKAIVASPGTTTFTVDQNNWFAEGQIVIVGDATNTVWAHFRVISVSGTTSVELLHLAYTGDSAAGVTLAAGSRISPAGVQGELSHPLWVYASGAAPVVLTAADIQLAFSVTTPDLTITQAGSWVLFGTAKFKYAGAEWAANATLTTKLRKTTGVAADLISSTFLLPIIAHPGPTNDAFVVALPPVLFHTALTTDNISLRAYLTPIPDAHDFSVSEASIFAIRVNSTTS